eukprot:6203628-Pleurochrysis_carterae.AAC.3
MWRCLGRSSVLCGSGDKHADGTTPRAPTGRMLAKMVDDSAAEELVRFMHGAHTEGCAARG